MSEGKQPIYDLFISYNHADEDWVVDELLPRLEEAGLVVCVDFRDFEIGLSSLANMEQAVDKSRHTLLVLTPNWVNSEWTDFESVLTQTADPVGRRRKLIPLMLERCEPPSRIAMLTYVDFMRTDRRELNWQRLLVALRAPSESEAPAASSGATGERAATAGGDAERELLNDLRKKMADRCSVSDLRTLCFSMGIDHGNYPSAKRDFIVGLLSDLSNRGRLQELVETLRAEMPWVMRES